MRELVGQDEVDPAHLGRIDARLVRDHVHHPLKIVSGFGTAGAAIGSVRHRVGVDTLDAVIEVRNHIRAGRHHPGRPGEVERLRIGAAVEHHASAQAGQLAVLLG